MLLQKKQIKPIKEKGQQPQNMTKEEWDEMDELACSIVWLTLAKNVYFNAANEMIAS